MTQVCDRKLYDTLVQQGRLGRSDLDVALQVAERRGSSLGLSLQRMGLLDQQEIRAVYEMAFALPYVDLDQVCVDAATAQSLGELFCRRHVVLPVVAGSMGSAVQLAMVDPSNVVAVDALRQRMGGKTLPVCIADPASLAVAINQTFSPVERRDAEQAKDGAVAVLDHLLTQAILLSASDVHVEPMPDCARVRLRCDGVLQLHRHLALDEWQSLLVRIKVLATLDIADSRRPQDGRFSYQHESRDVDIRVSVMPTDCGEAVVLRVLDRRRHALNFESLGVDREQGEQLLAMARRPEGMLLVSGPTGSGKSTTLYALVEQLRSVSLNIITLEDPVEFPATWVRQTSINDGVSMDYAAGVRAALRQDPDVMLIAEMRDTETATVALRAAMTGHRVLSTVHANSALASVSRLWDLGLEPRLLAGNLCGVVAQRLLRKLCVQCRAPSTSNEGSYDAVGCEACHQQGYRGRTPVLEIWEVDAAFDELLHQQASRAAFERLAFKQGMRSLQQAALSLVKQGVTSMDELERITGPLRQERAA